VQGNNNVVCRLEEAKLGRDFAKKAVCLLSRFTPDMAVGADDANDPRLALAGLIIIVCESARMNPVHDAFAAGWITGTGFTKQLMEGYIWGYYARKSGTLREWKSKQYAEPGLLPYPIKDLQAIYLVLNTPVHQAQEEEGKKPSAHED